MNRKEKEKSFKRDHIIASAENILLKEGMAGLSMDKIAKHAEFTRQTIYAYFKNRDELILILFLKDGIRRWSLLKEAISGCSSGMIKLKKFFNFYYDYYSKNPRFLELAVHFDCYGVQLKTIRKSIFSEYYEPNQKAKEIFDDIIVSGKKDGSIRKDVPVEQASAFITVSMRSVLNEVLCLKYLKESYYFNFCKVLINGLKP